MIDLASCMTVKSAEYKAHKRNALEVSTPDTTFLMFADTEKEKDDWYARARAREAGGAEPAPRSQDRRHRPRHRALLEHVHERRWHGGRRGDNDD